MAIPQKYLDQAIAKHAMVGKDENNDPAAVDCINGAMHVLDQAVPGIRNPSSTTISYIVVREEGRPVILNGTSAITIGNSAGADDTLLLRVIIHTALTGTLTLAGFEDDDGAAQSFVMPAGTVAGVYDFGGILNTAGTLQATLSSASDNNNVMIVWADA